MHYLLAEDPEARVWQMALVVAVGAPNAVAVEDALGTVEVVAVGVAQIQDLLQSLHLRLEVADFRLLSTVLFFKLTLFKYVHLKR